MDQQNNDFQILLKCIETETNGKSMSRPIQLELDEVCIITVSGKRWFTNSKHNISIHLFY